MFGKCVVDISVVTIKGPGWLRHVHSGVHDVQRHANGDEEHVSYLLLAGVGSHAEKVDQLAAHEGEEPDAHCQVLFVELFVQGLQLEPISGPAKAVGCDNNREERAAACTQPEARRMRTRPEFFWNINSMGNTSAVDNVSPTAMRGAAQLDGISTVVFAAWR